MFRLRFLIVLLSLLFYLRPSFGIDEIPRFYRLLNETKVAVVNNPKQALLLIDSMKMIIRPGDSNFELLIYELESMATFYLKQYPAAYTSLLKIDSLLRMDGDLHRLAVNYNRMGILFTEWGIFDKALDSFTKSYNIRLRLGQPDPIMFTLNSMARLYLTMGLDSLSYQSIQKALEYCHQSTDTFNRAHIVFSAGQIFEHLGMLDTAILYYLDALNDRIAINNYPGVVDSYNALAQLYLKLQKPELSFAYAVKSFDWLSKFENESYYYTTYLILLEASILQGNHDMAMLYARKIQDKAFKLPNQTSRKKAYDLLSKVYEHQGDLRNSLLFAKKYQSIQDSIIIQFNHDTEQRLTTLWLLQNSMDKGKSYNKSSIPLLLNNYTTAFLITGIVLLIFFVGLILQNNKIIRLEKIIVSERKSRSELVSENEGLKQQVEQSAWKIKELENLMELQKVQRNRMEKNLYKNLASINDGTQSIVKIAEKLNQGIVESEIVKYYHEKLYSLSILLNQRAQKYLDARVTRREYHPDLRSVNAVNWLKQVENILSDLVKTNQNISFSFTKATPLETVILSTDQELLTEMICLLLDPSIRNSEKGVLEISFKCSGNTLQCLISDSRSSLSPGYQSFIQQWQDSDSVDSSFDTIGYNLSVYNACKVASSLEIKLCFEHYGESGIIFNFSIPVLNDFSQKSDVDIPDWSGKHILIAEDDMMIYETMKSFLKPTHVKVSHALTGVEIGEFVKSVKFDVVLMDIKMPRMDGIDALHIIKQANPTLPVIACTAYASASERENFLQMGFADLIVKPVSREQLYNKLESFIRYYH